MLAVEGRTEAVSCAGLLPAVSARLEADRVTPVTGTETTATVTAQLAVMPPSAVVALIVALPAAIAVTMPPAVTVATVGVSLLHVTRLSVAPAGLTDAHTAPALPPTVRERLVGDTVTPETGIAWTVTAQVAVLLPSTELTVTVAVPFFNGVTVPAASPEATVGSEETHVTAFFVAFEGLITAERVDDEPPAVSASVVFVRLTEETAVTVGGSAIRIVIEA